MIIIGLLNLGTRLVGSLLPALPITTIMSNADGTACNHPCLFGIQPGVTRSDQAKHILDTHPLTHGGKWINDQMFQLEGPSAYLGLSFTPDGFVDDITLTDDPTDSGKAVIGSLAYTTQLGEYIVTFGSPVIGLPGSNYFVLEYPNLGIIAAFARPYDRHNHVRPTTSMNIIMLVNLRPCPSSFRLELIAWRGFTTIQRYYNAPRNVKVEYRFTNIPIPPPYAHCKP